MMGVYEGEFGSCKWKAYKGNCLDILKSEINDNSIDCVVTSPPYWERRAYGQNPGKDAFWNSKGWIKRGDIFVYSKSF